MDWFGCDGLEHGLVITPLEFSEWTAQLELVVELLFRLHFLFNLKKSKSIAISLLVGF